jgi:uncharacterized membrane protein YqjE
MAESANGGDVGEPRGLGALLKDLAEGSGELVRHEVRLARLEAAEIVRTAGTGAAEVAVGSVLALLGVLALLAGLIMLVGDQWLRDNYWLAALIVLVIAAGVGAFYAKRGLALLSPNTLVPDQTVATLQEDKEWLKRQLTSGATSS